MIYDGKGLQYVEALPCHCRNVLYGIIQKIKRFTNIYLLYIQKQNITLASDISICSSLQKQYFLLYLYFNQFSNNPSETNMLQCAVRCCTLPCCALLYCTVHHCTVHHCTTSLHCTGTSEQYIPLSTVCTKLYCTLLHCKISG